MLIFTPRSYTLKQYSNICLKLFYVSLKFRISKYNIQISFNESIFFVLFDEVKIEILRKFEAKICPIKATAHIATPSVKLEISVIDRRACLYFII